MKSNPVPVLMLTYNSIHLTKDAVMSVLEQDVPVSLIAYDDGSTDGTLEWLRSCGIYTRCYRRAGVTKMWNLELGYQFGFNTPAQDYVLVINNDIRLRPDTLRTLIADGGQFVTAVGTSSGAQFPGEPSQGRRSPHPDFSCFLIRRECWLKVGPFDESMRIYASDGDYHLRMHQAGIEAYALDLPFYHYASGTLKQADEKDRQRIMVQADRDRETFQAKWGFAMGSKEYYAQFGQEHTQEPAAKV
jgi:GT2 family glycosyltransferase